MKAIVVGVGARAHSWIDTCKRNANVELVAFVEPVEENRRRAADKYSIPDSQFFHSLEQAKGVEANFVVDVTPPAVHERVSLDAFAMGLHYIGEKPMSDDFARAKRMVAAAEQAGKTLMVTQNYRFGRLPRTAHRVLKEGRIGDPSVVVVGFYRAWATRQGTTRRCRIRSSPTWASITSTCCASCSAASRCACARRRGIRHGGGTPATQGTQPCSSLRAA